MGWWLALTVAVLGAAAATALTPWARRVCHSTSPWLRRVVVAPTAALLAGSATLAGAKSLTDVGNPTAPTWARAAVGFVLGVLVALLVCSDLAVLRLPDPIMVWAWALVPAAILAASAVDVAAGVATWGALGRAALAGLVLFAAYLAMALLFPAGMSWGDVKFAGVLGMWMGWQSWLTVWWGTLLAAILGGVTGIAILLIRRGDRRTLFPFGPMMGVGAWIAVLAHP